MDDEVASAFWRIGMTVFYIYGFLRYGIETDTGPAGALAHAAPNALQAYEWKARPRFYQRGNAPIFKTVRFFGAQR